MGDASMSVNRKHSYMIKLRVKDRDFAEEFARCLSVILGRSPPRVKWHEKTQAWHTQLSSLLLQNFLRQELKALVPVIAHCDECKAAFIKGFFDSEGSMSKRSLTASNEDLELLILVCETLQSLRIETTGPNLASKGGRTVIIKGKFYRQNEDLYYMRVRSRCLERFQAIVGFSIGRKSAALSRAISQTE
jgi:DNA endonuclease